LQYLCNVSDSASDHISATSDMWETYECGVSTSSPDQTADAAVVAKTSPAKIIRSDADLAKVNLLGRQDLKYHHSDCKLAAARNIESIIIITILSMIL
jgi:hypothetical protein